MPKLSCVSEFIMRALPRPYEQEFEYWPAVADFLETPPSPLRTQLIVVICIFFTLSIICGWLLRVDIYAVAAGRVQNVGRSKIVQPADTGRVVQINTSNGELVSKGQLLLRVDPSETLASRDEYAMQVDELSAEIARRNCAIANVDHVARRDLLPPLLASTTASVQLRQEKALKAQLSSFWADINVQEAKQNEGRVKLAALKQTNEADQQVLATLRSRLYMRQELRARRLETTANVLDAEEAVGREVATISDHKGQISEIDAQIELDAKDERLKIAKFIEDNRLEVELAETKRADALQELAKAQIKSDRTSVLAPIDGVVQELSLTTVGQMVTAGQQLMTIVPTNEPMEIQALIANGDIGFVQVGQEVVVKIDTFPFTIYGSVKGKVVQISRDAVSVRDASDALPTAAAAAMPTPITYSAAASVPATQNLAFPVTISIGQSDLKANDRTLILSPGMTCEVEIKTGRRRILDYVLSPLRETVSRAIHER